MRKRYIYDKLLKKMVEIPIGRSSGVIIMGDLPDFVSPIDGTVVHGRKGLREHEKRHNVTNVSDFKETWAKQARDRERFFNGDPSYDRKARVEALVNSFDKLSRRS